MITIASRYTIPLHRLAPMRKGFASGCDNGFFCPENYRVIWRICSGSRHLGDVAVQFTRLIVSPIRCTVFQIPIACRLI